MKKYFQYILIVVAAIAFSSCNKDFLNRTPETSISDADFWKTSSDLQFYANTFYNTMLPSYMGWGEVANFTDDANNSDNMIGNAYSTTLNGERVVPGDGGGWAYGDWSTLRDLNYFLVNYEKVEEPFENISAYVGEILFFRSMFYFNKLKRFGDLPWVTIPLQPEDMEVYTNRIPRDQVVDSILNDLDQAISYLPTKGQAQPSRITKEVAKLFQARIALYEGTWEKYHAGSDFGVSGSDGRKFLEKAAAVSEELIANSGGHALAETPGDMGYWELFNQRNYDNNPEVLLWRQYDITLTGGHRWARYSRGGAGVGITKDAVESYLCIDGLPISVSPLYKGDNTLKDVVANRDPRLNQSIYVDDELHIITNNQPNGGDPVLFEYPQFEGAAAEVNSTGYQLYKGHNPDYQQQQDQGDTGLILYRFAEAYLIYAEAKAELGEFTQVEADASINLLRRRVGMPDLKVDAIVNDPDAEFKNISPLLNEIRRERRVELGFEGFRKDDLYRWAAMGIKVKDWKPLGAKKAQWEGIIESEVLDPIPVNDQGYIEFFKRVATMSNGYQFDVKRDYLDPIPIDQLNLNTEMKQNPGWD